MYIQVRLLKGFSELLWYKVPAVWADRVNIGSIIKVPLRTKMLPACVEYITHEMPNVSFAIKEMQAPESLPDDHYYQQFIEQLAAYYQIPSLALMKRMRSFLLQKNIEKDIPFSASLQKNMTDIILTAEQQTIIDFMLPQIAQGNYTPTLMHGITGSGKTEVYKKCLEHAFAQNKTSILLLPEVTLAVQFTQKLKAQIHCAQAIIGFHSATSSKEKKLLWQRLQKKEPLIIIGVHLPILLPIPNLGLIIIDEEHEIGFQEKKFPKINSKEAALMRAHLYKIPIILGSATPSISSLHAVHTKKWHFFQLKQRFSGALPTIKIVNVTKKEKRSYFWISKELEYAIKDRLTKKEQTIIFLNRRGFSFFLQCESCNVVLYCDACSVSLTLHENNQLRCHYCGISMMVPAQCFSCKHQNSFLKKGIGTQQLVSILQKIVPSARIARADLDTTINKKKWQATVQAFEHGEIDILVGTQTITKGYHFPKVTLVGIIWADLNLHMPFYNATETTLQQLLQVAGRAGRATHESLVIVQTMLDHSVFSHMNEIHYSNFYHEEIAKRKEVGYPPAVRFADITLKNTDELMLEQESKRIAVLLSDMVKKENYSTSILGPALPPVHKINHMHMRKIYLKAHSMHYLIALFKNIEKEKYSSEIFFTPNPLT